jgi:hypothetical protein
MRTILCLTAFCLGLAAWPLAAADSVIITEFCSDNRNGLLDEDGSREDWIEVFNAGTNAVNLFNWSLTDSASSLNKWRFPATNIAAGQYIVVFASNKDRAVPGARLHTNFKLDPVPGEYLALVRPDNSIATEFAPAYPSQAQDVSYGVAVTATTNNLVAAGAPARYLVPTNFALDGFWTDAGFDDSAWSNALTGIGFGFPTNLAQTDVRAALSNVNSAVYLRVPFTVANPGALQTVLLKARYDDGFVAYLNGQEVARRNAPKLTAGGVVANSTNDWANGNAAQGYNGWFYGYYNKTIDTNDNTFSHQTDFNTTDSLWTFNGTTWALGPGDPPWTQVSQTTWHPNGVNNTVNHWAIRRWVSTVNGVITARVTFAKGATGGNGATLRVMMNGTELTARTVAATDTIGFTTNIVIGGVDIGDTIDFALDSTGTDFQATDGTDTCIFGAELTLAASGDTVWNSVATGAATASENTTGDTIDITYYRSFLVAGTNVLSIHGLNSAATDADFLALPELFSVTATVSTNQRLYFSTPTPGAVNGTGNTNIGPLLFDIAHAPREPATNEPVSVTVRPVQTFNALSNVTLVYRVMFNTEITTPMNDAGTNGDATAGDGIFSARIPAGIATPGQMVRYAFVSRDVLNQTNRSPLYATARSPQYYGYVIKDSSLTNPLPVLQWYVTPTDFNNSATDTPGGRGSIYFFGQFLDNVGMTLHGQSSAGFPKKSYNFNLNPGSKLKWNDDQPSISDFALITAWADRSYIRYPAVADTYAMAGAKGHFTFAVRVHTNGGFHSVAHLTEQGNEDFLERINYDPNGALYKIYNTLTTASGNEKKSREWEGIADLATLVAAANNGDVNTRLNFAYDNYNFPSMIAFLAAKGINSDHDCCHKNFYLYRDSDRSAEWHALPWDIDLSLGHVWTSTNGNYFDDTTYTNVPPYIGQNNAVFGVIYNDATLRTMWARRVRTLMDELLQAPGTPTNSSILYNLFNSHVALVTNDAVLDFNKWVTQPRNWTPVSPVWGGPANATNSFTNEVARIRDYWLPGHRNFLFNPSVMTSYGLPAAQPASTTLRFGTIEYNPSSRDQSQEYVQLQNTNNFAVDISGWRIEGGVEFTFQPGTVIPANTNLYVSPSVRSFRSRTVSPMANQRAFVVGGYSGQLSARGETLRLINRAGLTNANIVYPGAPSPAQQYLRVTEIMYHPGPTNLASPYPQEDFEYIELKNISTNVNLNLVGVRFANAIDFTFTALSAVTNLAPGQTVVLVRNPAAFVLRHGAGATIAGTYAGNLENSGERVQLLDAANEEVLDFSYNNSWYPVTDGLGFSLVVVDEFAVPDDWNSRTNWRASAFDVGSPGTNDSAPVAFTPVLVNEVLSASGLTNLDAVELWNPGTNSADISHWFISDDFFTPKKFRVPAGTVLVPGAFVAFDESHFNTVPGVETNFAFNAMGDDVFVFSADADGHLTGYFHGFHFGASDLEVSFGRHINSVGEEQFVAQRQTTFGATNAGPLVGPLVVSEIMYHPPDIGGADDSVNEYIELQNISTNTVLLFDPAASTNTWRLKDAVSFNFPTNASMPPGGFLLVVGFNPTNTAILSAFRSKWSIDTNVPVLGPYSGQLDNSTDNVELAHPQPVTTNGFDYVLVDKADYHDATPWDAGADGIGAALHRIVADAHGNDPTNWHAAMPTPGAIFIGGAAPVILAHPTNVVVVRGSNTVLTVVASNAPFRFQWRFNGANIDGATNDTLALNNIQLAQTGDYSVTVLNGAGVAFSSTGRVTVVPPVTITVQPAAQQIVLTGTNVALAVTATGNGTLRYQWALSGLPIPGATNATFTFTNAQLINHGIYTVTVMDDYTSVTSSNALVFLSVRPGIPVAPPTSVTVVQGANHTFSLTATGAWPMSFRWLINGLSVSNLVATALPQSVVITRTNSGVIYYHPSTLGASGTPCAGTVTFTNLQTNTTVRAAVTNLAGSTATGTININVLRDSDGDGVPDVWEIAYGMATNNAADGLLDFDNDGMINRDEYFAGTNPADAASVLRVFLTQTNLAAPLQFDAQSNITYTVQYRTNFDAAPWQTLSNVAPQPGIRTIQFASPPETTNNARYFRVLVPPTP